MPVTAKRFAGYPAQFKDSSPATVDFADLSGFDLSSNNAVSAKFPMGVLEPVAHGVGRSKPAFGMRTMDLNTLLTNVTLLRPKLWDGESHFYMRERADDGFLTGATHPARQVNKGVMTIESITATADDENGAEATLQFLALYDGTNDAVINVTGQDLTDAGVPTPAYVSCYQLYCPYHNGSQVEGVQSMTINTGIQLAPSTNCPGVWDEVAAMTRSEPTVVLRTLKVDEADSWGITGGQVNTTFDLYLQKVDVTNATGTGRVAPATAEHIKFSFTAGHIDVSSLGVQGTDDAELEITIRPSSAIAVSLASALP